MATEEPKPDGALVNILKCFSININGRAVLNTDSPGEGHLTCMNGLRYSGIFNGFRIMIVKYNAKHVKYFSISMRIFF